MAPLERIPRGFLLWIAVLAMMAGLSRDVGSGGMFRRGTGLWLLVLTLALGLRDRMVPCKECADTDGARKVDDVDSKWEDASALGGCATCTADETIRPMGPMVSLALPPSSRPTKRRAGLFSQLY